MQNWEIIWIFVSGEAVKKSMVDSDVPLLWWNVGMPEPWIFRENLFWNKFHASCLLFEDLLEQLESVPMMTLSELDVLRVMYWDKWDIDSMKSSS